MAFVKDREHAGEGSAWRHAGPLSEWIDCIVFGIQSGGGSYGTGGGGSVWSSPFDMAIFSKITLPWSTLCSVTLLVTFRRDQQIERIARD